MAVPTLFITLCITVSYMQDAGLLDFAFSLTFNLVNRNYSGTNFNVLDKNACPLMLIHNLSFNITLRISVEINGLSRQENRTFPLSSHLFMIY